MATLFFIYRQSQPGVRCEVTWFVLHGVYTRCESPTAPDAAGPDQRMRKGRGWREICLERPVDELMARLG